MKVFKPTDKDAEDGIFIDADIDYTKIIQYLADDFGISYSTMSDIVDYLEVDLEKIAMKLGVEKFI